MSDAGLSEKQSRAVVQAVVDTTTSLDLATRKDMAALEKTVDKIYLWIRWGFGILLAFMFFLSTRGG